MSWNSTETKRVPTRAVRSITLAGLLVLLLAPKVMAGDFDPAPGPDGKYVPLVCAQRVTCQQPPACTTVGIRMVQWGSALKSNVGPVEVKFAGAFRAAPTVLTTANWPKSEAQPLVATLQNHQDTEVVVKTLTDKFLVDSQNAACDYCVNWVAIGNGVCPR